MSDSPLKAKPEPGTAEAKPEPGTADEGNQQINIRVQNQQGQEVFFKIKRNTKMSKLMDAYVQRQGVQAGSVRFVFDGQRIGPNTTPNDLNMEDNDIVDCILEQTGGSF